MKAVHNWQSRHHIDMIFPGSTALYFADSLDITSQIADEIKKRIFVLPLFRISVCRNRKRRRGRKRFRQTDSLCRINNGMHSVKG
ncbi:hypothetical protein [Escherichia coli]|uniref:hypothetical protein n=1 Tax=Escherichia coli TaxID=562 RepID=UPI001E5AF283|nr:hypothetical protein [Escherichia coli]